MLKIQSFEISDSKGMNDLLAKHRLAKGAGILISNGFIAIPYEDGEPINKDQKRIQLLEEKNMVKEQMNVIIHSNRVLEKQIEVTNKQIEEVENKPIAEKVNKQFIYEDEKTRKEILKKLQNVKEQLENQFKMNEAEISRMSVNIEVFEETLSNS